MKRIFYITVFSLLALNSCKNKETAEEKEEGFVIHGEIGQLEDSSMAVLSYKQNDSTVTDSAKVENGEFRFGGKLIHPAEAVISLRHGETFPEQQWQSDSYHLIIENSEIELTANDSIKKAKLKGSVLNDQSAEIEKMTRPLTDEIIALYARMKGRSEEDKWSTYDTIQVYVDSIKAVAHKFIVEHPDSYVALQRFLRHEMPKNFDPEKAEDLFKKFPEDLRNTPTGKQIADKIAIAKKSMIGKEAMDFTQTTLEGEEFRLSSLKGKYVLIDFWAAWCKPCRAENPNVVKAYNRYKDENFEIVGVSLDASKEQWKGAVEKDGLPWIHVSDLKYWQNEVAQQYGIKSVPANLLIDPDGIIIAKNLRGEALTKRLSEILGNV
ncbi:TlpA disulfide reductase family protein [Autumnicola musiva]|uniref:TlpA disulfide reductase family protein n=1 Tax=Autumnicola musiva TaxID=3075589 RepID=A0ABU3D8U6_9FLAO|nr:TlpA disulfide reductase family protein [Zunongwangia sp. F117]MDT0677956.1 TlpA disulfide reductase family protein [Zunongwangia sp. F117]